MLWGLHCAPFVSLLGTFMASLEHLGQSWGTLWDTWVSIRTSKWRLGTALEILRPPETPSQAEGSQVPRLRTKIDPLQLACGFPWSPWSRPLTAKRSTNYNSDPPFHTRRGSG